MQSVQDTLPVGVRQALHKQDLFAHSLFGRPESLSALLPYDEYIEEGGIFRNKDGSLGAVFEVELQEHEAMSADAIVDKVQGLRQWFQLPTNCTVQVLFDQAFLSALDPCLAEIEGYYPESHPVSKKLFERRMEMVRSACHSDQAEAAFRRRGFVSIRHYAESGGSWQPGQLGRWIRRGESVLFGEMKAHIQQARAFGRIVADFQKGSGIPLKQLGASDLIDLLRQFFNPGSYHKRSFAPYNPAISISDQVIFNSPTLDYGGIEREGVRTRTLSLKTSPQFAFPGGMAYFTKLGFPFKLSLNVSFPSKRQVKTFFDLKEFFLQNTPSARARRQREEVLQVQERLARDDRCLHATFNVIVEGKTDEELDERVRAVVNLFHNNLECEAVVEEDIGLGLCLNALPLNYSVRADASARRQIRILRSDLVNFVPIFDSFRGMKKPLGVYLSRERNLVRFSLFENETSNHTVVLADSGSGKSAFIVECIQAAKRMQPEPLVFVIDKKSSSVMLSEYFEGDLTLFERDKDVPFSPFRGVYDEEKIAFLTKILMSGIRLTSPAFEIDNLHESALGKGLRLAYEKRTGQAGLAYVEGELLRREDVEEIELSVEDLIVELSALPSLKGFEAFGTVVDELMQRLMPFYGDGTYARYFRGGGPGGKRRGRKSGLLYVYDLDALDSDPVLQALMTMAVFEEIRRTIRLPENAGRGGLLILEELGMLGRNNPTASQFIIDFAETSRKLGLWLVSATPRPANYVELEAGRAMWSVADNFVFLQMSGDNLRYLRKESDLLDDASVQIIESLRTVKGRFADIYFMNKKKTRCGAFRYVQTPLDRWISPTNARDMAEASKALRKFKGRKWEALEFLAAQYPEGVERYEEERLQERMRENGSP